MNPAELLVLVTAKAIPLEQAISGYGRLTQYDIVYALASVKHPGASLLLRVKFCGQNELIHELDRKFWIAVMTKAEQEKWPYPIKFRGKEFYRNLGRLALSESISTNICLECGGTGHEATEDGKIENCGPCRGSGRSVHSDRSRARLMGMSWSTWNSRWDDHYKQVQQIVDDWQEIGLSGMAKRLKNI
jgi:hypothetical protein